MEPSILAQKDGYCIRQATARDCTAYYEQNYCPLDREVARLTGCKEFFSRKEVASFFLQSLEDGSRRFFLVTAPDGRIVGESVINEIDWEVRSANFRLGLFHPTERGKGLGTWVTKITRDYAFDTLHLHRLALEVFSFNPRAERVYRKAGFLREGVGRDAVRDGEVYGDVIQMSMLEEEWRAVKKREAENAVLARGSR